MNYQKINTILMRVFAVLLMLVLLSTAAVTGRFARYISSSTGSDSARVAKFSVTANMDEYTEAVPMEIIPGEDATYPIQVTNDSEVAVRYSIVVDNPYQNFPVSFHVKVGTDTTANAVPFNGDMAPNSEETFTLVAAWNGTESPTDYNGRVELIELTLTATQID